MIRRAPGPLVRTLAAVALLVAPTARGAEVIKVTGTGSALGAVRRVARAYESAHPGVSVRVLPSLGTSGAIQAVSSGAIDVALAGRPLRASEGPGLTAVPFAWSPFVFAVGPKAGATTIGMAELVRIYRGEQRRWPGGEQVRPVLRPAGDTDSAFLRSLAPALADAYDAALARPGMLVAATNQDSDALAGRTPGALGVTSLAQLTTEPSGLSPLAWEGVEPTLANLAAGRYPLWKPFFAVIPAGAPARTRAFVEYLGSTQGRSALEAAGCLSPPFPSRGGAP